MVFNLLNKKEQPTKTEVVHKAASEASQRTMKKPQSKADLIEHSWKFLERITEHVMNRFSKNAQQNVNEIGKLLNELGMVYQHVVFVGSVAKQSPAKIQAEQKKIESGKTK